LKLHAHDIPIHIGIHRLKPYRMTIQMASTASPGV
jgi:hypothetical protein